MKKGKINSILSNVFLIAMLGFFVFAIVHVTNNANVSSEPTYIFGYRLIYLTSGSMEPTMKTNSVAFTKKVDNLKDIKVDDIISFRTDSGVRATHRVIGIDSDGIITTKGDNNRVTDSEPILIENVESKVLFTMNWTAYLIMFVMAAIEFIKGHLLISIICMVVIIAAIIVFKMKDGTSSEKG